MTSNDSSGIARVSEDYFEFLTTEQMIEVDRLMTDVLKIELMQMMENAGRNLARLAIKRFLNDPRRKRVVVLAGTGGNGGGAMVAARRLHQWGADVSVLTTKPDEQYSGVPEHQLAILRRLGVAVNHALLPNASLVPDLSSRRSDWLQPQRRPTRTFGGLDYLGKLFSFADIGFGRSLRFGFNFGNAAFTGHCRGSFNDVGHAESRFQFNASQVDHGRTIRGRHWSTRLGVP